MKLKNASNSLDENSDFMSRDIVQALSEDTGLLMSDVRRIIASAEVSYKTYQIPKRNGGLRNIAQPSRQVKLLQRSLMKILLSKLPVHSSATAYVVGKSIYSNAEPHKGKGRAILKMDFKDFFPSIRSIDWINYCKNNNILSEEDRLITAKILFKREFNVRGTRLAIGAPSSPLLSNIIMYDFDKLLSDNLKNVSYTRYADDLTFSASRTGYMVNIQKDVRKILKTILYPKLFINDKKTVYATTKYKRVVTGIILTNDGKLSIGRDKKRKISASVHHAKLGLLAPDEAKKLSGYLAYVNVVEPDFLKKLKIKYGEDIIKFLKQFGNPNIN
ncbi:MAG: retron St85 family RNA-directed DNA polymerase [Acetobacter orientalis]|uniref:retron St85 family RNA-directed DNA polymerase n=1 Tax=Acetobacter orientalis TaxID=146474 RepID=UPI0039EC538B